jgi:hypothetical protein
MKYKEGLSVLRFNEQTGKWYKDKPNGSMNVYLLSDKSCEWCGEEKFFYAPQNPNRFCSLSCNTKYRNSIYGISEETAKKISQSNKGKKKNVPPETQKRLSEFRRQRFMGSGNPMWKGGITPQNEQVYNSSAYWKWRDKIYERDNYTCQKCNERGGRLCAHHIKKVSDYKELIFELDNGITLCYNCHGEVNYKEEEFEQYFTNVILERNNINGNCKP